MTPVNTIDFSLLYRFCAQSMYYPESSWFNNDYLSGLYLLLDALEAKDEKEQLQSYLKADDNVLENLQIEYTRLFINGTPHVVAPPYASVYMDKSLLGQYSEKIMLFYSKLGYSLKEGSELPDHLINQLEFLAILVDNNDDKHESEFLQTLFRPWFIRFYERINAECTHPFYLILVQFIDYLTKEEDEHVIQLNEA